MSLSGGFINTSTYYVMHRAKHPVTGEIIKGMSTGGKKAPNGTQYNGATLWYPKATPGVFGDNGTQMSVEEAIVPATGLDAKACQVKAEPWLLHSTHYSAESALEAARVLILYYQKENVKIVKNVDHEVLITIR